MNIYKRGNKIQLFQNLKRNELNIRKFRISNQSFNRSIDGSYSTKPYKAIESFEQLIGSSKAKVSNNWRSFDIFSKIEGAEESLLKLGSDYEKQINSVEDKNEEIMNAYYNIIGNDEPKNIGTFFFYGTYTKESNVWDLVESYLGTKIINDDSNIPNSIISIHCRRTKENISYYEQLNIDGSRNFVKKDINKFGSDFKRVSHMLSSPIEYIYFSPNVDNLTLIVSPPLNYSIDPYISESIEKETYSFFRMTIGKKYLFPYFRATDHRDLFMTKALDRLSIYTNPIFGFPSTDSRYKEFNRALPPRSDSPLFFLSRDEKQMFSKIIKNRIYKVFFRNNENYLKSIISEKFKNSKSILQNYKGSSISSIQGFLSRFGSIWFKDSIALKLTLVKIVENKLNQYFYNEIEFNNEDVLIQIGGKNYKDKRIIEDKLKPFENNKKVGFNDFIDSFQEILNEDYDSSLCKQIESKKITKILEKKKKQQLQKQQQQQQKEKENHEEYSDIGEHEIKQDDDINKDFNDYKSKNIIDFKNEWLFTTHNLRSPEFLINYREYYSKLYNRSLYDINEIEAVSIERIPYRFYEIWNILYKRILSKLICNDIAIQMPQIILDEAIGIISKNGGSNVELNLRLVAENFKSNINSEYIDALLSKEFNPSISFEQFRDILIEEFYLFDEKKQISIQAFSKQWNYIYFKAVSKKLANEIVNNSYSNVILPFFNETLRVTSFDQSGKTINNLYDKRMEILLKNSTFIKDNLGFKSKKDLEKNK